MKLLVFDLDGTLADTTGNIVYVVNKTLEEMGVEPLPDEKVISFVGHGSRTLLERCLEYRNCYSKELYEKILPPLFRNYYEYIELYTNLYDGVMETLASLPGIKVVLTNKPGKMAKKLLPSLEIDHHFEEIIGGDDIEYLKPNPHYLNYYIKKYKAKNTFMIGDSPVDIEVAQHAGAKSIAVTYGFTPKEKLTSADILIDSFRELSNWIC